MRVKEMMMSVQAAMMTVRPELLAPHVTEEMAKGAAVIIEPWDLVTLLKTIRVLLQEKSDHCGLTADAHALQDAAEQTTAHVEALEKRINVFVGRLYKQ